MGGFEGGWGVKLMRESVTFYCKVLSTVVVSLLLLQTSV